MDDKQDEKENQEVSTKSALKILFIAFGVGALIGVVIMIICLCIPDDYEYKILSYNVITEDGNYGVVDIQITNNTNNEIGIYVQIGIYDNTNTMCGYNDAILFPKKKSTDTYRINIENHIGTLFGTTAKIIAFQEMW